MRVVDNIRDFGMKRGMWDDRVLSEDGESLSRVKKSSFYSSSSILEHVPSRKSSMNSSIVSHVEAFEQVILLVG